MEGYELGLLGCVLFPPLCTSIVGSGNSGSNGSDGSLWASVCRERGSPNCAGYLGRRG